MLPLRMVEDKSADVQWSSIGEWIAADSTARMIGKYARTISRRLARDVDGRFSVDEDDVSQEIVVSILTAGLDQPAPTTSEAERSLIATHADNFFNRIRLQERQSVPLHSDVITADLAVARAEAVVEPDEDAEVINTTAVESAATRREQRIAKVQSLIAVLPDRQRAAILSRYFGETPPSGMPKNLLRAHLAKATKSLLARWRAARTEASRK